MSIIKTTLCHISAAAFAEFSPLLSSRLAVTLAAKMCTDLRLVHGRGRIRAKGQGGISLVLSKRADRDRFYRITAATDDIFCSFFRAHKLFIAVGV